MNSELKKKKKSAWALNLEPTIDKRKKKKPVLVLRLQRRNCGGGGEGGDDRERSFAKVL